MTSVRRHGKWISQSVREKHEPWSWILTSWDQWKKNRLWQMRLSGVHMSAFCRFSSSCSRQFKVSYICSASGRSYISADFIKDHSRGPPLHQFDTARRDTALTCVQKVSSLETMMITDKRRASMTKHQCKKTMLVSKWAPDLTKRIPMNNTAIVAVSKQLRPLFFFCSLTRPGQ